jgi:hypothetical protein
LILFNSLINFFIETKLVIPLGQTIQKEKED